jgi:hypothetical protein
MFAFLFVRFVLEALLDAFAGNLSHFVVRQRRWTYQRRIGVNPPVDVVDRSMFACPVIAEPAALNS